MIKPDLQKESIDEIGVPGLEEKGTEIEYLDDFIIDKDENAFAYQLIERNNSLIDWESFDEIAIKGEPIPERLDNEYIKETEVVKETTTTNLRSGTTQKATTETTTNNRRNLDNMGRKVIVDTSETITTKGSRNLDNMGRHAINVSTTKTVTTTENNNLDNMGRHVINN